MHTVQVGNVQVSRLVIGGNPFSGFSHQSRECDREMVRYYTVARIKEALRKAEAAGINTFFGRTDRHIQRMLAEYWDEGGTIQWFGQTASELGDQLAAIRSAAAAGAKGAYIHGGIVDFWYAQRRTDLLTAALETMREVGVAAGFAGHTLEAHAWIRDHLQPDFSMCSYYDPTPRTSSPHHVAGAQEIWDDAHRDAMVALIQTISWPVVHYKVFAGGNRPIQPAFQFLATSMRATDLVCIGHYLRDNPNMIAENAEAFERVLQSRPRA